MEIDKKSFEKIIKIAEKLGHECTLQRKKNSLEISGISTNNVIMYKYTHVTEPTEKEDAVAVKTKELLGAIRGAGNTLKMEFKGEFLEITNKKRTIKLRVIEPDDTGKEMPELILKAKYVVDFGAFMDALSVARNISSGDNITLIVSGEENLHVEMKGMDNQFSEEIDAECKGEKGKSSLFGYDILKELSHITGNVIMSFDEKYPMKISQVTDDWVFNILVAPRTVNE